MQEGSGDIVADVVGEKDGTRVANGGTKPSWESDPDGFEYLNFTDTVGYVDMGSNVKWILSGGVTWLGWARADPGGGMAAISAAEISNEGDPATTQSIVYMNADDKLSFAMREGSTGNSFDITCNPVFADSEWHFFVMETDGTTARIYQDNVSCVNNNVSLETLDLQNASLYVGTRENEGVTNFHWNGDLAGLAVVDDILTDEERTAVFNEGPPLLASANSVNGGNSTEDTNNPPSIKDVREYTKQFDHTTLAVASDFNTTRALEDSWDPQIVRNESESLLIIEYYLTLAPDSGATSNITFTIDGHTFMTPCKIQFHGTGTQQTHSGVFSCRTQNYVDGNTTINVDFVDPFNLMSDIGISLMIRQTETRSVPLLPATIDITSLGFWIPIIFWLLVMLGAWSRGWILTGFIALAGFLVEFAPPEQQEWTRITSLILLALSFSLEFAAEKFRARKQNEQQMV